MLQLPKIIYGTAWKKEATCKLVFQAVQSGFRAIDTACQPKHYSEEKVGEALALLYKEGLRREELFVQTKFTPLAGQDPNNTPYDKNLSLEIQVQNSFEVSKRNLQSDYVDAYILHTPLFPSSHLLRVWRAMEKIYKNREALSLGISNCYDLNVLKKLYENSEIKPRFVQNRFYAESDYDKELRVWCNSKGITYQSFWTLSANPHILGSKTIIKLSLKYKKSQAQILFNYLNSIDIIPLSGTTSLQHMQEDLSAFDFALTQAERHSIAELF